MRLHIYIVLGIFLVGFVLGTFLDLKLTEAIFSKGNSFGIFMSAIGTIPGYMILAILGGGFFALALHKKYKVIYKVILYAVAVACLGCAIFFTGREFFGENGFYNPDIKWVGYLIVLPIAGGCSFLGYNLTKSSKTPYLWLVYAIIAFCIFMALVPGVTLLKSIFHRPRYRELVSPAVVFTVVLLVTFIFTIFIIFRQKRYTEIKNDFINNMTHELKTPIASISLAAQMMNDKSVPKSEQMMNHLGGVINDESKRLRFLVEKVLQMSMFDRRDAVFKKKELDLNELVENIAHSFTLRVEHTGGKIMMDIGAVDSKIYVDEVHFSNVIHNLMDNAIKYRDPDKPVELLLSTWNDEKRLYFSIKDNGMGIKKENLKKIFDKFYRVHTGNKHDVKGFGLGLAYVKKVVDLHQGEIKAESELGKGTKFTISLPVLIEE